MRRLSHWWWQRQVRGRWQPFALGAVFVGIGVVALVYGSWDTIGYLYLAGGAFFLCMGVATWTYRRRHPLPPPPPASSWKDALS